LLRKALIAALVVAPFMYSPSEASAQTGLDRAAVATARAQEVGAAQNSHARQDMPAGVAERFAGQTLPPGIRWTRPEPEAPVTESDTGTTDPGTTDPGTTDPGTTEPVCLAYQNVLVGFSYQQVCVLWGSL